LNLLKQLLHRGCTHRFSWPRIDNNGRHYQICLSCGTAYEYDWKNMKRMGKALELAAMTTRGFAPQNHCNRH
jgi:hypothetical protein